MGKAKSGPCQTALIAAAPDADDLARSRKRTKWLANGVLVATVAVAGVGGVRGALLRLTREVASQLVVKHLRDRGR